MKPIASVCLILFTSAQTACFAQSASPTTSDDQLPSLVSRLQQSPGDAALREKIIKLALTLDPKPKIPEEARRHGIRAMTLEKDAKDVADYDSVIKEYDEALVLAPWWAEALISQSKACEAGGQYQKATDALKQYLLTQPAEADARTAQDKIYALEIKVEQEQRAQAEQKRRADEARAEQQRREQAAAAQRAEAERLEQQKQDRLNALKAKYDGAIWKYSNKISGGYEETVYCEGTKLKIYSFSKKLGRLPPYASSDYVIGDLADGNIFWSDPTQPAYPQMAHPDNPVFTQKYVIADDGQTIEISFRGNADLSLRKTILVRQK